MGRMMRSCLQSILKLVNTSIGMVGLAMIMYAVWLIRAWQREMGDLPFDDGSDHPAPWFIYTVLGLGYMLFIFLLFMLEAGVTADIFLNHDWEEDFPEDPSWSFNHFKGFIKSNFEICKWIGLTVVSVQGLCFLLSMVLKALGLHQYYDSDDDYGSEAVPLLKNSVQPPHYVVGSPVIGSRNDAWSIRINEKVNGFR